MERHADTADPDSALPHHRVRNHGIFTGVPVPDQPSNEDDPCGPKEADYRWTVPGKTIAAELKGQEEHDDCASKNPKAGNIKDLEAIAKGVAECRLLHLVGDGHNEDDGGDWDANNEVDVEACQVRRSHVCINRIVVSLDSHQRQLAYSVKAPPMSGPKASPSCPTSRFNVSNSINEINLEDPLTAHDDTDKS